MLHTEGYAYLGGKGDIKVWNPNVELDDEYSTSRVALKSGSFYDYEAMESGWQVSKKGETRAHTHILLEMKTRKQIHSL